MESALKYLTLLVGTVMICFASLSITHEGLVRKESLEKQALLTPEIIEAIKII